MFGTERSASNSLSLSILARVLAVAVFCALLAAIGATFSGLAGAVAVCVVVFLAAFAVGALLGFIFGVPRAVTDPGLVESAPASTSARTDAPPAFRGLSPPPGQTPVLTVSRRRLQSNTNLEKISDWLTTLLVGAGLVQLHAVGDAIYRFQLFLAEIFARFVTPSSPSAGLFAVIGSVVLIFGLCTGFLFMYLSTRLVLIKVFQLIELILAGEADALPQDAKIEIDKSIKLTGAGNFVAGSRTAEPTVNQGVNLMFDLLYKENPQQVIDLGASLLYTSANKMPEYWFYLAAAFGQKEIEARLAGDSERRASARDNALDCARRAVSLDETFRARLWAIASSDGPDDDLSGLRQDPEFRRLVGIQPGQ